MLGSPILYLKGMRAIMFQLSGFYYNQRRCADCRAMHSVLSCTGNLMPQGPSGPYLWDLVRKRPIFLNKEYLLDTYGIDSAQSPQRAVLLEGVDSDVAPQERLNSPAFC